MPGKANRDKGRKKLDILQGRSQIIPEKLSGVLNSRIEILLGGKIHQLKLHHTSHTVGRMGAVLQPSHRKEVRYHNQ